MLTLANARFYGEKLENESPFVEQEELKNENPCGDPELLTALESMCDSSDMLTSHDSFFSKDEGLLWCDTCGHGLADLGSLTQHVLEHIADSIENTKDSNVPHTTQRDLMIRQKPITDGDVEKSIENTKDSNVPHTTQRDLMIRKKPITDGDVEKKMWDTEQVQQLNPQWESVSVGQVKTTANQNIAILPVNDPHMPMLSISCDSKSNVSHDVSESHSNQMPLPMSSTVVEMAEVDATSEVVNSNLEEESGECSSDDFEEIFIERNKRKSKGDDSALQSPKRVRGQDLFRGVVKPRGTSVREKATTRTVPLYIEPTKRKLDETCNLVSVKRVKKAKATKKSKTECSRRERNLACCMNLEPSDDDHLLYCGECKKAFEGDCPVHGPYSYIQDKKVPEGCPDRADYTLPDDLEIKTSNIVGAGLGVFSKVGLESRIMFGPYEGDIISENSKSGYCWQIYKEDKASNFVDAKNKANSNWMRYVNCGTETNQNLVAFQYKGGIYYCTFKPVSPGDELLVWNRDDYTRELGLIRNNNLLFRPKYVNGKEIYQCVHCTTAFTSAFPYARHLRRMHGDKLASNYLQVLDQWLRENDNKYLKKYSKHLHFTTVNTKVNSISKVKQNKSDISQSLCDKQLKSAILKKKKIENMDENEYNREVCNYTSTYSSHTKEHIRIHTGEKPHKCEMCNYECKWSSQMKKHMRIHTGEKPYKCEMCSYESNHSCTLKTHMAVHTGEKPYKCEVCSYECSISSNLKKHMRIHTGEKPYTCEVCRYEFNHSGTVKTHMRIHTGEKAYKCEVCSYECNHSSALKTHMRIHTGEKPYKCDVCSYESNQIGHLKSHMRIHSGEKPYKCAVCSYEGNRRQNLKTHMRIHTGEKPYKCEVCSYECSNSSYLQKHMRIHTGEKPYTCEVCRYEFSRSGTLKTHMRIHTGEKPYKCEVCSYECNRRSNLRTHMRIHTGEKPYKCDVCSYESNQIGHLKSHMRIHSGEKPYKCDVCSYEGNRRHNLKTHMRIHTGEKPYKCVVCSYECNHSGALKTHMRIHTGEKQY